MSNVHGGSQPLFHLEVQSQHQPAVERHCPRCGEQRSFRSSARFRVNAHRKTIDAWLIFLCSTCDQRWNYPVHERRLVSMIAPAEFQRLMANDPVLAQHHAARAGAVAMSDPSWTLTCLRPLWAEAAVCEIAIIVAPGCVLRLDRLLTAVLGVSRERLHQLVETGALNIRPPSAKALRRPARDGQAITLQPAHLPDAVLQRLRASSAGPRLNIPAADRPG
jgi:hypothetical protein